MSVALRFGVLAVTLAGELVWLGACGGPAEVVATPPAPVPTAAPSTPPVGLADLTRDAGETEAARTGDAGAASDAALAAGEACPADMAYVDTTYCSKVRLKCLKDEYNKPNHITICHKFAPGQVCLTEPRRQRYCIDKYEYPNQEGAHPPVMVDWYDGMAMCKERGKRLCWESEWVAACEGPEKLPFPYGLKRSPEACNIDNVWLIPDIDKIYSPRPEIAGAELLRLDQSVRSGAKKGCVSGFGVHDLTGNLDEWVMSEEDRGDARQAGLKGGAWGHVRNACRPITSSHPPEFTYYFISFRCCKDAAGEAGTLADAGQPAPAMWSMPSVPDKKKPGGKLGRGWPPRSP
jgi:formylglycine-generating enzyme